MERRAYEAALIAAAKVALGGALFGCGAQVVTLGEEEEPQDLQGGAGGAAGHVGRLPAVEPDALCAMPEEPAQGWATFDADTFACCVERIADAAPADPAAPGGSWVFQQPDDAWIGECCAQILADNYDAIWSGAALAHPAPAQVVTACCVHQHGDAGCTPWGPPAPPEMEGEDPTQPTPWGIA